MSLVIFAVIHTSSACKPEETADAPSDASHTGIPTVVATSSGSETTQGGTTAGGDPMGDSFDMTASSSGFMTVSTGAFDTTGTTGVETGTTGEGGCEYVQVLDMPGELLTMTYENSYLAVNPLQPGQSFYCMRVEFDMQTADSLEQTLMDFPGCPIFTAIASLRGSGKTGELMASALFKYFKVGCTLGPDRIEMDTFVEGVVTQGPWPIGQSYRFVITVEPFTSTIRAFQDGVQVGPAVQGSIEGATVESARDPVIELGMKQPAGDAYFPNYGGSYSNLSVWASVAP